MVTKWVTALGFPWPFVVAANATVLFFLVRPAWNQLERWMLAVVAFSFISSPVVGRCFFQQLPAQWPKSLRVAVATLLTIGIVGVETYLALRAFIIATLPLGWIG